MTEFVLTNAQIRYGGKDISGILNQVALEATRNLPESTVFGDKTVNRVAGTKDGSITVNGWWDDSADNLFFTQHTGNAAEVISVSAEDAVEGSIAYSLQAEQANYVPGAAHGEIFGFSLELQGRNPLVRGRLLGSGIKTSTANGSAFLLGNVPSGSRVWAALHVVAFGGSSPTLDVIVESDAVGDFSGSETTRITFVQATGLGAQFLSANGSITDTNWRIGWTIGGSGSPTFTIFVVVGIVSG